eukprot:1993953-Karenia_brevis.AAC.1
MPVLRYVDDYFSADRPETAEHATGIFARLAKLFLGAEAIAEGKLEHGDFVARRYRTQASPGQGAQVVGND